MIRTVQGTFQLAHLLPFPPTHGYVCEGIVGEITSEKSQNKSIRETIEGEARLKNGRGERGV